MAEEIKKNNVPEKNEEKKINYHALPGGNPHKNLLTIETNPGFTGGAIDRYQVFVRVPRNEKEAQEFYGCSFEDFLKVGARAMSTRPAFKAIFKEDGTLPANGHKQLQELMDGYQVGRMTDGLTVKKQRALGAQVGSLMEDTGMTEEQVIAFLKEKAKASNK